MFANVNPWNYVLFAVLAFVYIAGRVMLRRRLHPKPDLDRVQKAVQDYEASKPNPPRPPDGISPDQALASIASLAEQRHPVYLDYIRLAHKAEQPNPSEKVLRYLRERELEVKQFDDRIAYFEQFTKRKETHV